MSNKMTKRGSQDNAITYEHVCDTIADMANINPAEINLGSTCIVLEGDGGGLEVYMAKSNKEWVLLSGSASAEEPEEQPE